MTCGFASGTPSADVADMRASHVATALAAFLAGSTAATVRPTAPAEEHDAVVLPFPRPVVEQPAAPAVATPARCGDSGGRTKAGTPCGARAGVGGRCHHHPLAA